MKSLSGKLGVILVGIGLFIFVYEEVRGAEWKLFKNTEDGHFYYDPADITHES